jgi:hypothetical protein
LSRESGFQRTEPREEEDAVCQKTTGVDESERVGREGGAQDADLQLKWPDGEERAVGLVGSVLLSAGGARVAANMLERFHIPGCASGLQDRE